MSPAVRVGRLRRGAVTECFVTEACASFWSKEGEGDCEGEMDLPKAAASLKFARRSKFCWNRG